MKRALAVLFGLLAANANAAGDAPPQRWAVYYTNTATLQSFAPYKLLALDSDAHPDLQALKPGRTLLGYFSVAEVGDYRPYFAAMKARGLIMDALPGAPGHYILDVRKPALAALVVEEIIPSLIRKGFDGVMLDTLDTAARLEKENAGRYGGMQDAAARLVKAIRMHYPELQIMINRGFEVLPVLAPHVNMIMAESIYTTLNPKTKEYIRQPKEHFLSVAQMLRNTQEKNPQLLLYSVDYWDPEDTDVIAEISEAQREQGLIPFVSTPDLQTLPEEKP